MNTAPEQSEIASAGLTEVTFYRGRVALHAILKALGVGAGDEVIVQAFTCVAVPEAVIASGAKPVYADIETDGYNLAPEQLASRMTARTKAIVVQHTFGVPAQIQQIMAIADAAGVPVIEDCCHALASRVDGRLLGAFGVAAFYSFEWGKQLVAGLGGSAVTGDPALLSRLFELQKTHRTPPLVKRVQLELQHAAFTVLSRPEWYWRVRAVFHLLSKGGVAAGNFHKAEDFSQPSADFAWSMPPKAVRRVRRKSKNLEAICRHSDEVVQQYQTKITTPALTHPSMAASSETCFARYPLRAANKDELLRKAREQRVELAGWYQTVVHPLDGDALGQVGYEPSSCPNAEQRSREIISLPTNRRVREEHIDRAAEFLNACAQPGADQTTGAKHAA